MKAALMKAALIKGDVMAQGALAPLTKGDVTTLLLATDAALRCGASVAPVVMWR